MIYNMYAIYDRLNGYTSPIPFINEELAIRYFKDHMIGNPTIRNTPEDFNLSYMGTFDTESGTYIQDKKTIKIVKKGVDFFGKDNNTI